MNINQFKTFFAALGVVTVGVANAQTPIKKFIDPANMDLNVKPGDDFYQYASGTWVKHNPVPAKETRWGSFNELRDFNVNAVRSLVEAAAADKSAPAGSVTKRVGDFYAAAMDSVTIEKLGYTPIKADLEKVKQINTLQDVLNFTTYMRTNGLGGALYGFGVGQDRKNVNKYMVNISQGGTTLGDRDYYLKDDSRSVKIREAYETYMTTLFNLVGYTEAVAQQKAKTVLAIEKTLAEAQMSRLEMRDPYKTYNKLTVADFNKVIPNINWTNTLTQLKVTGQDTVLVNSPAFFKSLNNLLTATPVADWKTYLEWNILKGSAGSLSSPFVKANFAFTQAQTGQKVQTPRWQRMSSLTDGVLGDLLGQLYVAKYFKPAAKARMDELIANLRKAFEIRIKGLEWMSDETKQKALAKLHAFRPKVGYTTKWRNYDGLVISRTTYFQNLRNASKWAYAENIGQLGKPVDRERFGMTPPTVNAYYSPTLNEIVFPAGILQFPFFHPDADDAINYGGIGAVIGHEMSHGFDDTGSQYDKDGNLKNWWTDEDRAKFNAKTKLLGEQFDKYTVLDTIHVNGKLTLGENIGDLGGLGIGWKAYLISLNGAEPPVIDGMTGAERFLLAWAQCWRSKSRDEIAIQRLATDPHSPPEFRVNQVVQNLDLFHETYGTTESDALWLDPAKRVVIW